MWVCFAGLFFGGVRAVPIVQIAAENPKKKSVLTFCATLCCRDLENKLGGGIALKKFFL